MDVSTWLRDLGLENYTQAFQAHHIDADVLPRLTADDLIALGISSIGHRRKLLDAIAALDQGTAATAAEPIAAAARPVEAERRQLLIDDYIYRHHHDMYPVVDNGRLVGCVSMNDIKRLPRDRWSSTAVSEIMQPCTEATAISPDKDAMEVLSLMTRTQNSRLLVTEGDRVVGVVTLRDVLNFLNVKLSLEEPEPVDLRYADVATRQARQRA
jgi:predicted transcriptional regulator